MVEIGKWMLANKLEMSVYYQIGRIGRSNIVISFEENNYGKKIINLPFLDFSFRAF